MKTLILVTALLVTGCATSYTTSRYQHSEQIVEQAFVEKFKSYNEQSDGRIFGVDLNVAGLQGLSFYKVDPDTGAKGYARRESFSDGSILTSIYLDEGGQVVKLDRYWFGFPRQDLLAIAEAQKKFFQNNYALRLSSATDYQGEYRLMSKEQYVETLRNESLRCENKCLRFIPPKTGISNIITDAKQFGVYLETEKNRFFLITLETKYMREYQKNKVKKYESIGGR